MLAIAKIKMILAKITPPPSSPSSTGSIIRLGRQHGENVPDQCLGVAVLVVGPAVELQVAGDRLADELVELSAGEWRVLGTGSFSSKFHGGRGVEGNCYGIKVLRCGDYPYPYPL